MEALTIDDSSKIQEGPIIVMKQQRLQLICFVTATSPAASTAVAGYQSMWQQQNYCPKEANPPA